MGMGGGVLKIDALSLVGVRVIFGYKTIINSMYFSLRSFRSVVVQALIPF